MANRPATTPSPPATIEEFRNIDVGDDDEDDVGSRGEEAPPDGGYGWICVAACFMINGFTWGTVSVETDELSEKLG